VPVRPLIGVVGAGTMGTGIAQVAAAAGFPVRVADVAEEARAQSRRRIREDLRRRVDRGRLEADAAVEALARLEWVDSVEALADAHVVIEAVPEDLNLKRDVFRLIDATCRGAAVLASNTSSLSISAMGAATTRPERVVGLHFFNPVPAMALVEIVRGARTSETTVDAAVALVRAMGKTPVRVGESPGFLVNRVARPFTSEAIRLLAEGTATVEVIDRVMREAGGYRMGPFELIDLIGVDVNLAVSRAIYEAFFHDPRYQPHPLQQQMVHAGLLGQKSGRGFYEYPSGAARAAEPAGTRGDLTQDRGRRDPTAGTGERVCIEGRGGLAEDLAGALREAGVVVAAGSDGVSPVPAAVGIVAALSPAVDLARDVSTMTRRIQPDALVLVSTLTASVAEAAQFAPAPERVVGFATLPPLAQRRAIEIQAGPRTARAAVALADAFWRRTGRATVEVGDGVGGVFPRIQALLSHEAVVALAAGVAASDEIDTAMRLGVNYPQGPLERAEAAGFEVIAAVMMGLQTEFGDPRYRLAPLLRRWIAAGQSEVDDRGEGTGQVGGGNRHA
jgi:3-hydroxybutyryl-CoA dehydrogenase